MKYQVELQVYIRGSYFNLAEAQDLELPAVHHLIEVLTDLSRTFDDTAFFRLVVTQLNVPA